jgi:hypothetical protein
VRGRSYERIDAQTLDRLADIARADRSRFYERRPEYRGRLLGVALCQGAALHYVECKRGMARPSGIKDFDVWSFFARIPGQRFPADKRNIHVDFGPSKYGLWTGESARFHDYLGRRVDLLMRDVDVARGTDAVDAVRSWLMEGRTRSQRALAAKAAVIVQPRKLRGFVAWPMRGGT